MLVATMRGHLHFRPDTIVNIKFEIDLKELYIQWRLQLKLERTLSSW